MKRLWVLAAVLWAATVPAGRAADWPQVGGNPQHTGYSAEALRPPFQLKWNVQFQPERLYPAVQPVIVAGRIVPGHRERQLLCPRALATAAASGGSPRTTKEHVGPIVHTAGVEGRPRVLRQHGRLRLRLGRRQRQARVEVSPADCGPASPRPCCWPRARSSRPTAAGRSLPCSRPTARWRGSGTSAAGCCKRPPYNEGRLYVAGMNRSSMRWTPGRAATSWKTEPIAGLAFKDYWPVVHKGLVDRATDGPLGGRRPSTRRRAGRWRSRFPAASR